MKELFLKYSFTYGQIISFFKGECIMRNEKEIIYSFPVRESRYTFHFYKEGQDKVNCFCIETLSTFTEKQLLYFLAPSNDGNYLYEIVPQISAIESFENFSDLVNHNTSSEINRMNLKLKEYNESEHSVNDFEKLLTIRPFENRILFQDGKISFPLSYNKVINNIAFLDGSELNNNFGFFSSRLIQGRNKFIGLFFSPNVLLKQVIKNGTEDHFYILFSNNFNHYLVTTLKDYSNQIGLPIEVYINRSLKEAEKLFSFTNLLLTIYSTEFESLSYEFNETTFTLHFFKKEEGKKFPLIEFVQNIHRRLNSYYNREFSIVEQDISHELNLITTSASNEGGYYRRSISFVANNDTLCIALNEILTQLSITDIFFKTI